MDREEILKVLEEAKKIGESSCAQSSVKEEPKVEIDKDKPVPVKSDEIKEKPKESKKVKKVKPEKSQDLQPSKDEEKEKVPEKEKIPEKEKQRTKPKLQKEEEIDIPEQKDDKVAVTIETGVDKIVKENIEEEKEFIPEESKVKENDVKESVEAKEKEQPAPVRMDSVRRKSKVFETAEMFSKSATQDKIPQKKVITGVKVIFLFIKI